MNEITFESLCGEHILSGVEMASEEREDCGYFESCNVLLFTLDGVTYKLIEDPDDGYRSFCREIQISKTPPKFNFPGVRVLCSMMESDRYEKNDCIVIRDLRNGEIIIEAGTKNYEDYYPYCHFVYIPENFACNQA